MVRITEEEKLNIERLLEEAKSIPMVECIYLCASLEENSEIKVNTILIANPGLCDDNRTADEILSHNAGEDEIEWNLICNLCKKYNKQATDSRLTFLPDISWNYHTIWNFEVDFTRDYQLTRGTIIFDRNGRMSQIQEHLLQIGNYTARTGATKHFEDIDMEFANSKPSIKK